MEEILRGQYDLSHVFIDCNFSYSDFTVFAHELAHYSLTKNTLFGILHFLIKQIEEPVFDENLNKVIGIMTDASERTQEVYAMYYELLHVSSQYSRFFNSYYLNFKQHPYYTIYQFSDLEWTIGNCGLNSNAQLIDRICTIAMNVDITKCMAKDTILSQENLFSAISKNKSSYMPDYRLKKMISLIQNIGATSVNKMTDCEIATASGIKYCDFSTKTVLSMLKNLQTKLDEMEITSSLVQRNIDNIVDNQIQLGYYQTKDGNFTDSLKQSILPECLNHRFRQIKLEAFPPNENTKVEIITLYDFSPNCLCELTNINQSINYILNTNIKSFSQFLKKYTGTIQFYFDDYDAVLNNWSDLLHKQIFFILKNPYYEFKNLVSSHLHPRRHAFILQMNDGVFFLFLFGEEKRIFYTCQSMINIDFVLSDFEKDFYTYLDISYLTNCDDWRNYVRIMSYFAGKNFLSMTKNDFIKRLVIPTRKT